MRGRKVSGERNAGRPRRQVLQSLAVALPLVAGSAFAAAAQGSASPAPPAPRNAAPEIDGSRPGGDPAAPDSGRSGGGPTGNDIQGGGVARGVVRPPAGVGPGIQGNVPDPTPGTTPVIPPPGTPGSNSNLVPR